MQSALRFDPGHEPAQRLRKRVKEVQKLKDDGNAAFKSGKFEEAIGKYGECLEVLFFFTVSQKEKLTVSLRGLEKLRKKERVGRFVRRCFRIVQLPC